MGGGGGGGGVREREREGGRERERERERIMCVLRTLNKFFLSQCLLILGMSYDHLSTDNLQQPK